MNAGDAETLLLTEGGSLHLGPAMCDAVLRQQVQMAIGISTLFGGRLVDIRHWFPGLVLNVQALKDRVNGEPLSLEEVWPKLHQMLMCWIDEPADADMLDLSNDEAYCVLVPDAFTWKSEIPVFTLVCDW